MRIDRPVGSFSGTSRRCYPPGSSVDNGNGGVFSRFAPDTATVIFSRSATPFSAFQVLETDQSFDLFFGSFSPAATGRGVSGAILLERNYAGNIVTRITTQATDCDQADNLAAIRGRCDVVTGAGGTRADADRPSVTEPFIAALTAGSYRLGVYEDASPSKGFARFRVQEFAPEVVPLPASGLLFLSAIGGMPFLRQRRA